MSDRDIEKLFGHTEKELDAMAEPFESGKWPEGTTTLLGRPRLAREEVRAITFKLPVSQIEALDNFAKASGRTRSQTLRDAVERELATAS